MIAQCNVCQKMFVGIRGLRVHQSKTASCQPDQYIAAEDSVDSFDEEEEEKGEQEDIMRDPYPRIFKTGSMATPNMRRTRLFKVCEFFFSVVEMSISAFFILVVLLDLLKGVPAICYYVLSIYMACHHGQFMFNCILAAYTRIVHTKRYYFG